MQPEELKRSMLPPSGWGFPLGEWIAADHKSDDPRREFWSWEGEGHRLILGPPGSGKYHAAIAPLLLTANRASIVIFDVANGEAARDTARHRATLGPVLMLDPFRLRSDGSGGINPLDLLRLDDREMLVKAKRLTAALMGTTKTGGDSDFWNGLSEKVVRAIMIYVATSAEENDRTFRRVREIVMMPFDFPTPTEINEAMESGTFGELRELYPNMDVLAAMRRHPEAFVKAEAHKIISYGTKGLKTNDYTQQTADENTDFLDLPQVQDALETTTLDLSTIRNQVTTLYIIIPEKERKSVSRWLRLIYAVIMEQMRPSDIGENGKEYVPLHVIIDEFHSFGKFERVREDMALVRKFKINYHIAVQKLSMLHDDYGAVGWQAFIPTIFQVLGTDELFSAKHVSEELGITTKPSVSHTSGSSTPGGSSSTNKSWVAAPLAASHEISGFDKERCIVILSGHRPLNIRKWIFYKSEYLKGVSAGMTTQSQDGLREIA